MIITGTLINQKSIFEELAKKKGLSVEEYKKSLLENKKVVE